MKIGKYLLIKLLIFGKIELYDVANLTESANLQICEKFEKPFEIV